MILDINFNLLEFFKDLLTLKLYPRLILSNKI